MCLDFDVEGSKGVCGSPQDTLEVFKLTEQVHVHLSSLLIVIFTCIIATLPAGMYVVENRDGSNLEEGMQLP